MNTAANPEAIVTSVNAEYCLTDGDHDETGREGLSESRGPLVGSLNQITDNVGRFVDAGADMVVLRLVAPFRLDELEQFMFNVAPWFKT
jgi:hypothetical protein